MATLATVVDGLHEALEDVATGNAAKRLMITLASKDSVSMETQASGTRFLDRRCIAGSTALKRRRYKHLSRMRIALGDRRP